MQEKNMGHICPMGRSRVKLGKGASIDGLSAEHFVCTHIDYICLTVVIFLTYNVLMLYILCIFLCLCMLFYFLIYSLDVPLCMIFNK